MKETEDGNKNLKLPDSTLSRIRLLVKTIHKLSFKRDSNAYIEVIRNYRIAMCLLANAKDPFSSTYAFQKSQIEYCYEYFEYRFKNGFYLGDQFVKEYLDIIDILLQIHHDFHEITYEQGIHYLNDNLMQFFDKFARWRTFWSEVYRYKGKEIIPTFGLDYDNIKKYTSILTPKDAITCITKLIDEINGRVGIINEKTLLKKLRRIRKDKKQLFKNSELIDNIYDEEGWKIEDDLLYWKKISIENSYTVLSKILWIAYKRVFRKMPSSGVLHKKLLPIYTLDGGDKESVRKGLARIENVEVSIHKFKHEAIEGVENILRNRNKCLEK